jgi:hypothetical protein
MADIALFGKATIFRAAKSAPLTDGREPENVRPA